MPSYVPVFPAKILGAPKYPVVIHATYYRQCSQRSSSWLLTSMHGWDAPCKTRLADGGEQTVDHQSVNELRRRLLQVMQSAEQHSERMSGGLLGGYKEVSTSDSEVAEAANFAAEQLSQRSNSLYPFKVKEVRRHEGCMQRFHC